MAKCCLCRASVPVCFSHTENELALSVCLYTLWHASGHELNCWVPWSSTSCIRVLVVIQHQSQWCTAHNYMLETMLIEEPKSVNVLLLYLTGYWWSDFCRSTYGGSLCTANNTTSCAISFTTFPVSGPTSPAITSSLCNLHFHPNEASLSNLREDSPN